MRGQLKRLTKSDGSKGFLPADIRTSAAGHFETGGARQSVARRPNIATSRPEYGTFTMSGGSANSTPSCVYKAGSQVLFDRVGSDRGGREAVRP